MDGTRDVDVERQQVSEEIARLRIIFVAGMVCFAHVAVAHMRTAAVLALTTGSRGSSARSSRAAADSLADGALLHNGAAPSQVSQVRR